MRLSSIVYPNVKAYNTSKEQPSKDAFRVSEVSLVFPESAILCLRISQIPIKDASSYPRQRLVTVELI
ncbi:hypothetical protein JTE90_027370 [Oedothorax gibbosus]|uniref:Uncharacterized protein n=1 Tax=Oedothorax gibbosus TaxID=931172 RepID=A0AAV6W0S1_9ARAC|nr:hypothetical protein JTE90_027370 [Oedothorax gibbosus]